MLFTNIFCIYLIFEVNKMEINKEEAAIIRDGLHNLNIQNLENHETYYDKLLYIIASGEGFASRVYKDTEGKRTVGYGFNMDRGNTARTEWNKVFKGSLNFDDVKDGQIELTKEQARRLKRFGVEQREGELAGIYKPYWSEMRLNERAIATDLYYQGPILGGETQGFTNI